MLIQGRGNTSRNKRFKSETLNQRKRKISPHSFRHAKAHQILDKSGTVKDVQFILGHSENNPISAFSYLRLNSTEAEKKVKMFL